MNFDFQLSYSVIPKKYDSEHENAAANVRRKLREIDEWKKTEHIETVLTGFIELKKDIKTQKRKEAEEFIKSVISEIMFEADAYYKADVYVSLMVDTLGSAMEFTI